MKANQCPFSVCVEQADFMVFMVLAVGLLVDVTYR